MKEHLIIFTRYPEPGTTKTRLIPTLGAEGAAALHRRMTEHTLKRARELWRHHRAVIELRHEGGSEEQFGRWLGRDLSFRPQGGGDLGCRMERAFREALGTERGSVVLVGTDCPALTSGHLEEAFNSLGREDLVLGPARDGGYYLIGLRRNVPDLFCGVPWGTAEVLKTTLRIAEAKNLRVKLLDPLDDVDRPEDLPVWEREKSGEESEPGLRSLTLRDSSWQGSPSVPGGFPTPRDSSGVRGSHVPRDSSAPRISIVIPARNEAESIAQALASTRGAEHVVERLVVDGGSRDETVRAAQAAGAKVLISPRGRAVQMNTGARAAQGDTLLFLHADTRLPRGFEHHVRQVLGRPGTVAGAFRLRLDGGGPALRVIEQLANLRSSWRSMPYGDQAIFLGADMFHRVGGFPEMALMEDFELMRRLRRLGRVEIAPVAALTSARRYEQKGALRTAMLNKMIIVGYLMGVSPDRLARWYRCDAQAQKPAASS